MILHPRFSPALVLGLVLTATSLLFPSVQDSVYYRPDAERTFSEAVRQYEAGRYDFSAALFTTVIDRFPESHRITAAYILGAKSYFHTGQFEKSIGLLRTFLDHYPTSRYRDNAHYTLALNYYRLGRYERAAEEAVTALELAVDPRLKRRSEELLLLLARSSLGVRELDRLRGKISSPELRGTLTVMQAEMVLNRGELESAKRLLKGLAGLPPASQAAKDAAALLEKIERSGSVKIGVLLPLLERQEFAGVRELGLQLLDGIRHAVDEHNADAIPKVEIDVRDTEQDAGVAARHTSELCADPQVIAILGPAFSSEAVEAGRIANERGVPLITPTATAAGIAGIGEYVFQANADYSVRGRAVAQYASLALGARRFAVLSATDTANRVITAAFLEEVQRWGGKVLGVEWYEPGETDLRTQLWSIRRTAMELSDSVLVSFSPRMRPTDQRRMILWGVPQEVVDSLVASNATVTVESLFGPEGRRIADSLRIVTQRVHARWDSLGVPVTTVDVLFLPISSPAEIGIVSSQVRYVNFQTQLVGTGNWEDVVELDQNRQYVDGIIFTTDAFLEETNHQYVAFTRRFSAAYGRRATVNTLFGYDAMKAVLRAVQDGARRREELASALSRLTAFQGIRSKISFSVGRVNSFLTLVQFKNRIVRKIGEIDVNNPEERVAEE